jgi:hypothetical protein
MEIIGKKIKKCLTINIFFENLSGLEKNLEDLKNSF